MIKFLQIFIFQNLFVLLIEQEIIPRLEFSLYRNVKANIYGNNICCNTISDNRCN